MRLIVRPEAEADIADAYAWYESQQPELGNRFIAEMSRCIADIEHNRFDSSGFERRHDVLYFITFHTPSSLLRPRNALR